MDHYEPQKALLHYKIILYACQIISSDITSSFSRYTFLKNLLSIHRFVSHTPTTHKPPLFLSLLMKLRYMSGLCCKLFMWYSKGNIDFDG